MITIDENIQELFKLFPENADIKRIILEDKIENPIEVDSFTNFIEIPTLKEIKTNWIENFIPFEPKIEKIKYKKTDKIYFSLSGNSLTMEKYDKNKLICEIVYTREI